MANPTIDLTQIVQSARQIGFFQVVVPFLLVFAIVYGILEALGLFERKEINAVIALVLGFLVTGSGVFTATLQAFTPYLGVILFFLLSFLVVLGLATGEEMGGIPGKWPLGIGCIAFAIALWIFASGKGLIGAKGASRWVTGNLGIIITVAIILIGIGAVVFGGGGGGE